MKAVVRYIDIHETHRHVLKWWTMVLFLRYIMNIFIHCPLPFYRSPPPLTYARHLPPHPALLQAPSPGWRLNGPVLLYIDPCGDAGAEGRFRWSRRGEERWRRRRGSRPSCRQGNRPPVSGIERGGRGEKELEMWRRMRRRMECTHHDQILGIS